jgi:hypothetical protein
MTTPSVQNHFDITGSVLSTLNTGIRSSNLSDTKLYNVLQLYQPASTATPMPTPTPFTIKPKVNMKIYQIFLVGAGSNGTRGNNFNSMSFGKGGDGGTITIYGNNNPTVISTGYSVTTSNTFTFSIGSSDGANTTCNSSSQP